MNKTILILLAFSFCLPASAQDTTNFWPHHVGDMWEYYLNWWGIPSSDTVKVTVMLDSTGQGGRSFVKYRLQYLDPNPPPGVPPLLDHYIVDTNGNVYAEGGNWSEEYLTYKLRADVGQKWIVREKGVYYEMARITSIYQDTIFNVPTSVKQLLYYAASDSSDTTGLIRYAEELAGKFGTIYRGGGDLGYTLFLRASRINGMIYGDTIVVTVKELLVEPIPKQPQLLQNYPNPFNSSTLNPL